MIRPKPRLSRARLRAALDAATVPAWTRPHGIAADAASLSFVAAPGRLPSGLRVYAVGDVHGALDALRALHAAIRTDLARRPMARARIVYLGDLIDHGCDSAGVVRALAAGPPAPGLAVTVLRGDHEQMLLDALDGDRAAATDWLHAGGGAALRSWGVPPETPRADWPRLLPASDIAFLRATVPSWQAGEYLFVHAGVRPGVRWQQQTPEDLRTIRLPFLASEAWHGAVIVHGHSVASTPELRANRIGLDTGAGFGGKLSCAILENERVAFLSP